jgi:hypothetical protein
VTTKKLFFHLLEIFECLLTASSNPVTSQLPFTAQSLLEAQEMKMSTIGTTTHIGSKW